MIKKRISKIGYLYAFTMLELIIVISIIGMLLVVAAPSFTSLFQRQLLRLSSAQIIQHVSDIHSNSFLDHQFYKFQFSNDLSNYTIWKYYELNWELIHTQMFKKQSIELISGMSAQNSIVYGPNGNVYLCLKTDSPDICSYSKLNENIIFRLSSNSTSIYFNILPNNGVISSNYIVQ